VLLPTHPLTQSRLPPRIAEKLVSRKTSKDKSGSVYDTVHLGVKPATERSDVRKLSTGGSQMDAQQTISQLPLISFVDE